MSHTGSRPDHKDQAVEITILPDQERVRAARIASTGLG